MNLEIPVESSVGWSWYTNSKWQMYSAIKLSHRCYLQIWSVTDLPSKLQLSSNQRSVRCEICVIALLYISLSKSFKHRPNITKAGDVLLFSRNSCDAIGPFLSPTIPRTRPLLVVSPIWSVTDLSPKLQQGGNPKRWQWHSIVPNVQQVRSEKNSARHELTLVICRWKQKKIIQGS